MSKNKIIVYLRFSRIESVPLSLTLKYCGEEKHVYRFVISSAQTSYYIPYEQRKTPIGMPNAIGRVYFVIRTTRSQK